MLSIFKNKLKTNEAKNWQKLKTASLNSKFTGYCKKKSVLRLIILFFGAGVPKPGGWGDIPPPII